MRLRFGPTTAILGLALALPAAQGAWAQAVVPLHPQVSPPTLQLAAAPENKFDGEWEGTFSIEHGHCRVGKIPIKATIKDGEFSTVVKNDTYQNKLEGSVSDDGRLSFWDRFEYVHLKHGPANFPIKSPESLRKMHFRVDLFSSRNIRIAMVKLKWHALARAAIDCSGPDRLRQ